MQKESTLWPSGLWEIYVEEHAGPVTAQMVNILATSKGADAVLFLLEHGRKQGELVVRRDVVMAIVSRRLQETEKEGIGQSDGGWALLQRVLCWRGWRLDLTVEDVRRIVCVYASKGIRQPLENGYDDLVMTEDIAVELIRGRFRQQTADSLAMLLGCKEKQLPLTPKVGVALLTLEPLTRMKVMGLLMESAGLEQVQLMMGMSSTELESDMLRKVTNGDGQI
jgi:hypothetical protein